MNTKLNYLFAALLVGMNFALMANSNPDQPIITIKSSQVNIDEELKDLDLIGRYVETNHFDYDQLNATNPEMIEKTNLSSGVTEDDFFANKGDVPLGIPGFLWGFCFGVIGMLVVYLVMDDGADRKKQVKQALYGCIVGTLLGYLLYALVIATTMQVDPSLLTTFNIA
ncbi:MAG: hypothetical protein WAU01_13865 [Saprospiraceae bacterium]